MTAREFIQEYKERIRQMSDNRARDAMEIAFLAEAQRKLRIQTQGQDFEGADFAPYTPRYAESRAKAGYQVEYVDFTRTGRLMANTLPEVIEQTDTDATIEVTARDPENQNKLRGAVRKRGNIVQWSQREIALALEANRERLRKYLGI